jgi:DNA-binding MarR family transcriptional regulator
MSIDVHAPDDLADDLTTQSAEISEAMAALMRSHSTLRSRMSAGTEVDMTGWILLSKLARGGPRRAGELAEVLCADPSTVSRQVALLVRAGVIERRADPADGRASILALTPAGEVRVEQFSRVRSRSMAPVVAAWSSADRQDFIRLLTSYSEGLERHRDEVIAAFTAGNINLATHPTGTERSPS